MTENALPTFRIANPELPARMDAIVAAVDEMTVAVDGFRDRLERGEIALIEGLEERVLAVYAAVEALEGDDADGLLKQALRALLEAVNRMERALRLNRPQPVPKAPPGKAAAAYAATPKRMGES